MAICNYSGILDALAALLRADSRLSGVRVYAEEDPQFGLSDVQKAIAIYLSRRQLHPNQPLAAGKSTRWLLSVSIWCFGFSIENFKAAADIRDGVLDQMELVLNDNRTVSGTVEFMHMDGGDFLSAQNPGDGCFVAGVETSIAMQVTATSP